jgi:rhodanese-related sulfurtransferase/predicted transcriptional regulator
MSITPNPKHAIYEQLAAVAQALGNAHRLELLERVAQGAHSVEALASAAGLSVANASRHLQVLRRARLVETERRGKQVFYRLAGDREVVALLKALGTVAEHNVAEVQAILQEFFTARDAMEPISRKDLSARIRAGTVTVLDVRPQSEFSLGHVPGAINIPSGELMRRLGTLPKGVEIVAYCRGPYCVMSFEAVAALRARGFKVRRLEDGFPEWKAAGLRVSTTVSS